MASSTSYWSLLVAAFLAGIAMAGSNPVTNAIVSQHVPRARRGTLMGVKQSGVQMGQLVAGSVLPPLAAFAGWRLGVASGTLLIAAFFCMAAWSMPRGADAAGQPGGLSMASPSPGLRWLVAYTFMMGMAAQAAAYLPLYAHEAVGASATLAGMLVGVVGAVGMVARIVLGRMTNRTRSPAAMLTLLAFSAVVALVLIAVAGRFGSALLWIGAVGYGASAMAANVVVMVVLLRIVATERLGRASGAVGRALFAGFTAGPVTFGALVEVTGTYEVAWLMVAAVCGVAGLLALGWRRSEHR